MHCAAYYSALLGWHWLTVEEWALIAQGGAESPLFWKSKYGYSTKTQTVGYRDLSTNKSSALNRSEWCNTANESQYRLSSHW